MKIVVARTMIERSAQQLSDHLKLALQDEITASQLSNALIHCSHDLPILHTQGRKQSLVSLRHSKVIDKAICLQWRK